MDSPSDVVDLAVVEGTIYKYHLRLELWDGTVVNSNTLITQYEAITTADLPDGLTIDSLKYPTDTDNYLTEQDFQTGTVNGQMGVFLSDRDKDYYWYLRNKLKEEGADCS